MIIITLIVLLIINILGFSFIQQAISQHNEESYNLVNPILGFIPIVSIIVALTCIGVRSIIIGILIYRENKEEYIKYKQYQNNEEPPSNEQQQ